MHTRFRLTRRTALLLLFLGIGAGAGAAEGRLVVGGLTFRIPDYWRVETATSPVRMVGPNPEITLLIRALEGSDPEKVQGRAKEILEREAGTMIWEEDDSDTQAGMPLVYFAGRTRTGSRKVYGVVIQAPEGLLFCSADLPPSITPDQSSTILGIIQSARPVSPASPGGAGR